MFGSIGGRPQGGLPIILPHLRSENKKFALHADQHPAMLRQHFTHPPRQVGPIQASTASPASSQAYDIERFSSLGPSNLSHKKCLVRTTPPSRLSQAFLPRLATGRLAP